MTSALYHLDGDDLAGVPVLRCAGCGALIVARCPGCNPCASPESEPVAPVVIRRPRAGTYADQALLVLEVHGPQRAPSVARALGRTRRETRHTLRGLILTGHVERAAPGLYAARGAS